MKKIYCLLALFIMTATIVSCDDDLPKVDCTTFNTRLVYATSFGSDTQFTAKPSIFLREDLPNGNIKKIKVGILEKPTTDSPLRNVKAQLTGKTQLYNKAEIKKAYKTGQTVGGRIVTYSPSKLIPVFARLAGKDAPPAFIIANAAIHAPKIRATTTDSVYTDSIGTYPALSNTDTMNIDIAYLCVKVKYPKNKEPICKAAQLKGWIEIPNANNGTIEKVPVKFDKKSLTAIPSTEPLENSDYQITLTAPALKKKVTPKGLLTYLVIDNGIGIGSCKIYVTGEKAE